MLGSKVQEDSTAHCDDRCQFGKNPFAVLTFPDGTKHAVVLQNPGAKAGLTCVDPKQSHGRLNRDLIKWSMATHLMNLKCETFLHLIQMTKTLPFVEPHITQNSFI